MHRWNERIKTQRDKYKITCRIRGFLSWQQWHLFQKELAEALSRTSPSSKGRCREMPCTKLDLWSILFSVACSRGRESGGLQLFLDYNCHQPLPVWQTGVMEMVVQQYLNGTTLTIPGLYADWQKLSRFHSFLEMLRIEPWAFCTQSMPCS